MRESGLTFWITREYRSAGPQWSQTEIDHGLNRTYRVIFQQDYHVPDTLISRVKALPIVEDAHLMEVGFSDLPPSHLSYQASRFRDGTDLTHLAYAKAITRGNQSIKIAVLDTGVNLDHPELIGKITDRADFVDLEGLNTSDFIGDFTQYDKVPEDEVGHGTHVAGIIAGRGLQMDEGVGPDCSIMAVRVLATMQSGNRVCGAGIVDNINPAIKWAVDNGADVINMSLGMRHTGGPCRMRT